MAVPIEVSHRERTQVEANNGRIGEGSLETAVALTQQEHDGGRVVSDHGEIKVAVGVEVSHRQGDVLGAEDVR
jgi:hypothetical protein